MSKKKTKIVLALALGLFLAGICLVCLFADRVAAVALFHPWKPEPGWNPSTANCELVKFETADGSTLEGLYFPCENSSGTILYSHGNGDILKNCEWLGNSYREEFNVSILIYDYRGYGRSEGNPTAPGILEDGRAGMKWLAEREGIEESEIIQMGFSLGGSVAIDLASREGARGLIVQSTFSSLPDIAVAKIPFIPAGLILHEQLNSIGKIESYKGPLFLSHGTADRVIPYFQGERLYGAANEPKTLYTIENGPHSPPDDAEYFSAIRDFIENLP